MKETTQNSEFIHKVPKFENWSQLESTTDLHKLGTLRFLN